jgi:hypothetical protein
LAVTAAPQRTQAVELRGFAPEPGSGSVTIVSYDRVARWRRALVGLGTWWGVALLCVLIPVAHFVLVPSFFLFGVYTFAQRIVTAEQATDARGTCPDCGREQPFELAARWQAPQSITCRHCHRGLTLTVPVGEQVTP